MHIQRFSGSRETMERNNDILQPLQSLCISSTNLDFGPQFASNKTPQELVATINLYLKLHSSSKLGSFRLFFCPFTIFLPDIEAWVEFIVRKEVEKLDLDFSMGFDRTTYNFPNGSQSFRIPSCIFQCKSLTHLSLSHCDFYSPPTFFTGLYCLQSLSFAYVNITGETLQSILANCLGSLNSLSLKYCPSLESIKVSARGLRLKQLTIINCWDADEIEIYAPELQSFIYNGELVFGDSVINVPSLEDAFICSIDAENTEPDHDYIKLVSEISHVRTLTVCTATLMRFSVYEVCDAERLPLLLPNLKELQLLMNLMRNEELIGIYAFFRLCPSPSLEKLFIQLPKIPYHESYSIEVVEEPLHIVFNNVKVIKLNNFTGCESEMRLVTFLLDRTLVLESLVLVTPTAAKSEDRIEPMILRKQLELVPKASAGANAIFYESFEDDMSLIPTHNEYYCDCL